MMRASVLPGPRVPSYRTSTVVSARKNACEPGCGAHATARKMPLASRIYGTYSPRTLLYCSATPVNSNIGFLFVPFKEGHVGTTLLAEFLLGRIEIGRSRDLHRNDKHTAANVDIHGGLVAVALRLANLEDEHQKVGIDFRNGLGHGSASGIP